MGASFRARLALVVLAALAVRVVYALTVADDANLPVPGGDRFFYVGAAQLLAEGHGFVHPAIWPGAPETAESAGHPPLWSVVLAPLSVLGLLDLGSARVAGGVAGAVAVVFIGLIGRRMTGERAGLAAAGLAALYPAWISGDASGMSEAPYAALVGTVVLALLVARDRGRLGLAVLAGAAAGAAALTRTEGALLVPLLAWPLLWARGGARPWALPLAATVAALAVVLPWTARNAVVLDRFVPISTNEQTVVAGANCAESYYGPGTGSWSPACLVRAAGRVDLESYDEGVLADRWRSAGLDYARENPRRLVTVVVPARIARTWRLWPPSGSGQLGEGENRHVARLGSLVFLLVLLPLGLVGLVRFVRSWEHRLVVLALAVMVTATSALGTGAPRFARAAELGLLVCAGAALAARRGSPYPSSSNEPVTTSPAGS